MAIEHFTDEVRENHAQAIERATTDLRFDSWIDGEHHAAASGETFPALDPAVNTPITDVARGGTADIDHAVSAAREAADEWGTLSAEDRSAHLNEWIDALREHRDRLVLLESLDTGKPIADAAFEVDEAFRFLEYYADVVKAAEGSELPVGPDAHAYTRQEPYGVVGQISAWNFPLYVASWKLGPALAAGNAVVMKPAEDAPLTTTLAAQLSADILPDGVLNIVNGMGEEAGVALTEHTDVDKLSFTGSDMTGEKVMATAAANITPVTLELGGKSPFLVFPDADLDVAVDAASYIFYNAGQSCDACSRVIVHEDVAEEFTEKFVAAAESYEVGDPLAEGTTMGPLSSRAQFEKVTHYLDLGRQEGATLLTGGDPVDANELADGWFVQPTVFGDVENDMRIAQDEIFGPVQTIITFSDYEEAIALANDVEYGLASGVATTDLSTAHRAAEDIEAGSVWVNQYPACLPPTPFGGYKRSGIGREAGKAALEDYTRTKTVSIALDDPR
jgi:aldehyde dehydrogenase (NAD+)